MTGLRYDSDTVSREMRLQRDACLFIWALRFTDCHKNLMREELCSVENGQAGARSEEDRNSKKRVKWHEI